MPAAARLSPVPEVEDGAALSSQVRRAGDAAGFAIDSRGRAAAPRLVSPAQSKGGGCAAAVINQWKRLRRSEYVGDRVGDDSMATALPDLLLLGMERSSRGR